MSKQERKDAAAWRHGIWVGLGIYTGAALFELVGKLADLTILLIF